MVSPVSASGNTDAAAKQALLETLRQHRTTEARANQHNNTPNKDLQAQQVAATSKTNTVFDKNAARHSRQQHLEAQAREQTASSQKTKAGQNDKASDRGLRVSQPVYTATVQDLSRQEQTAATQPRSTRTQTWNLDKREQQAIQSALSGPGNPNASTQQIKSAIDQILAEHPGNPDGAILKIAKEAAKHNVNLQQIVDTGYVGFKEAAIYLSTQGIDMRAQQTDGPRHKTANNTPDADNSLKQAQAIDRFNPPDPWRRQVPTERAMADALFGPGNPDLSTEQISQGIADILKLHNGDIKAAAKDIVHKAAEKGIEVSLKQIVATGLVSEADGQAFLASMGVTPEKTTAHLTEQVNIADAKFDDAFNTEQSALKTLGSLINQAVEMGKSGLLSPEAIATLRQQFDQAEADWQSAYSEAKQSESEFIQAQEDLYGVRFGVDGGVRSAKLFLSAQLKWAYRFDFDLAIRYRGADVTGGAIGSLPASGIVR